MLHRWRQGIYLLIFFLIEILFLFIAINATIIKTKKKFICLRHIKIHSKCIISLFLFFFFFVFCKIKITTVYTTLFVLNKQFVIFVYLVFLLLSLSPLVRSPRLSSLSLLFIRVLSCLNINLLYSFISFVCTN